MMYEILLLIVGAILGVIFAVWFQEPFSRLWRVIVKTVRQNLKRLFRHRIVTLPQPHEFRMGGLTSDAIIIEGTGEESFKSENIRCHYNSAELQLPTDLAMIKNDIQCKAEKAKGEGQQYHWNGPWYALERYTRGRTDYEEDFILDLWFRPTDYYTFLATSMSLDKYVLDDGCNLITVREKYLKNDHWDTIVPFLATSFGINVIIITSDEYVVITQRSLKVGSRPGYYNVSVNEGLSRVSDWDSANNPSPYKSAVRGAKEELNIDLDPSDIHFLTFISDTTYYQWGLLGMARAKYTATQIQERRTTGVKDKWENETLYYVPFNVQTVAEFVLTHSPWTTGGIVSIVHTLIHEFGISAVEKAFA